MEGEERFSAIFAIFPVVRADVLTVTGAMVIFYQSYICGKISQTRHV